MSKLIWKESNKLCFTPGGDPLWECPNCGWEHVYGVENNKAYHTCPNCNNSIKYNWEQEDSNE